MDDELLPTKVFTMNIKETGMYDFIDKMYSSPYYKNAFLIQLKIDVEKHMRDEFRPKKLYENYVQLFKDDEERQRYIKQLIIRFSPKVDLDVLKWILYSIKCHVEVGKYDFEMADHVKFIAIECLNSGILKKVLGKSYESCNTNSKGIVAAVIINEFNRISWDTILEMWPETEGCIPNPFQIILVEDDILNSKEFIKTIKNKIVVKRRKKDNGKGGSDKTN